ALQLEVDKQLPPPLGAPPDSSQTACQIAEFHGRGAEPESLMPELNIAKNTFEPLSAHVREPALRPLQPGGQLNFPAVGNHLRPSGQIAADLVEPIETFLLMPADEQQGGLRI